ncbi:MAG: hypothetical protein ACP5LX_07075, partial [Nitrososphaeria archaeon]
FKSMNIDSNEIDRVREIIRAWPPSQDELKIAEKEISDKVVKKLIACGGLNEIRNFVDNVTKAWNAYPIFYIISKDYKYALQQLYEL